MCLEDDRNKQTKIVGEEMHCDRDAIGSLLGIFSGSNRPHLYLLMVRGLRDSRVLVVDVGHGKKECRSISVL